MTIDKSWNKSSIEDPDDVINAEMIRTHIDFYYRYHSCKVQNIYTYLDIIVFLQFVLYSMSSCIYMIYPSAIIICLYQTLQDLYIFSSSQRPSVPASQRLCVLRPASCVLRPCISTSLRLCLLAWLLSVCDVLISSRALTRIHDWWLAGGE